MRFLWFLCLKGQSCMGVAEVLFPKRHGHSPLFQGIPLGNFRLLQEIVVSVVAVAVAAAVAVAVLAAVTVV